MTSAPKPRTYNGDLRKLPRCLAHLGGQRVWVVWKWWWDGKKWTKPPFRADDPDRKALTNDPTTWGDYQTALQQVLAGRADGFGFTMNGRNIGGNDLDHCRDPETETIASWAREYCEQFPGAYIEITVSGTGLRILGASEVHLASKYPLPEKGNGARIELFSNSTHYLTLSCNELGSCRVLPPIGERMQEMDAKLRKRGNQGNQGAAQNGSNKEQEEPHQEQHQHQQVPWSFATELRLRSALGAIPTDEKVLTEKLGNSHGAWVRIGMAIERLGWGERGYVIFRDWSMQSTKEFNEKGLRTQWASFIRNRDTRDSPVTIATIFHYAQQFGWSGQGSTNDRAEQAPPLVYVNMTSWDEEPIPEQDWAVPDRIPDRQCVLFSGEGSAGKSTETLHLCAAHVLSRDWLRTLPEPGKAIFVDAEDDEKVMHRRLAAITDHYQVTFGDLIKGGLHLISWAGQDAVLAAAGRNGKIAPTPLYARLLEAAGDIKPKMIGIASSANVFAGSEIDRSQVQQFISLLTRLAIMASGAVTLITHPSLTGINTDTGLSGNTQWHNSVRARMYMKGIKPENGEQPDNDLRELVFKKNNYGPVSESIVLRYSKGLFLPVPGATTLDRAAHDARADDLFLTLLSRVRARGETLSPKSAAHMYAPTVLAREPEAKTAGFKKKDFEDAMVRLFTAKKIHLEPYGAPSRKTNEVVPGPP
jgi:RecA-family ATPase